jgi:uncharacterized repeat protein (TIGR01451 family)
LCLKVVVKRVNGLSIYHARYFNAGLTCLIASLLLSAAQGALADLRAPAWFDPDGVGSGDDWHYRVPIDIPSGVYRRNTVVLNVDFNSLLSQMGVSGTLDPNSVRVVRDNGALATTQQFTDTVFNDATDAVGNGWGEVRFLMQRNGPRTFYLYFDILENGTKPAWSVNQTINGNFEFSSDGQQDPPGWNGTSNGTGFTAAAMQNAGSMSITTDDLGSPPALHNPTTTVEDAYSGNFCYLVGARDSNENGTLDPATTLTRNFRLPPSNPGIFRLRYRVKGWDSSQNGAGSWDFLQVRLVRGGTTVDLVGPAAGNYATFPFSPNYGTSACSTTQSGYGQFNGWDTDTNGTHRSGMTSLTPQTAPWFEVTYDLSSFPPNSVITLEIETRHEDVYKTWFHIDDVQWSVADLSTSLGTPEGFGVDILNPTGIPTYNNGDTLNIQVRVDALPTGLSGPVTADLIDPLDTVAYTITLFNDGSHGDGGANDAWWGDDNAHTFLASDFPGTWTVRVYAKDGSGSTLGAPNGLIHIPSAAVTPYSQANYYNVDDESFTLVTPPNIMLIKTAVTDSDPVNGSSNPKAIPGAEIRYTITSRNMGGTGTDNDSVYVTDPIPANTALYVGSTGMPGGPVAFSQGTEPSGLTYTYLGIQNLGDDIAFSNNSGADFTYQPLICADCVDPAVTHVRVNPKGIFNPVNVTAIPEFSLQLRVRVQ